LKWTLAILEAPFRIGLHELPSTNWKHTSEPCQWGECIHSKIRTPPSTPRHVGTREQYDTKGSKSYRVHAKRHCTTVTLPFYFLVRPMPTQPFSNFQITHEDTQDFESIRSERFWLFIREDVSYLTYHYYSNDIPDSLSCVLVHTSKKLPTLLFPFPEFDFHTISKFLLPELFPIFEVINFRSFEV